MTKETSCLWLHCKATIGQFSNEVAINGTEYGGEEFSLFCNVRFVDCPECLSDDSSVDILLQVVEVQREGDLVLVRLPNRTLANGQTITVHAKQLEVKAWQGRGLLPLLQKS